MKGGGEKRYRRRENSEEDDGNRKTVHEEKYLCLRIGGRVLRKRLTQ